VPNRSSTAVTRGITGQWLSGMIDSRDGRTALSDLPTAYGHRISSACLRLSSINATAPVRFIGFELMQGEVVFLRMDSLGEVKVRMRSDWDARARADAERAIYSHDAEGDVDGFAGSGRANYDQLVRPFLPVLLNGRDSRECRAIEIGCGVGRMTEWFARDFGEVDAFDVSPEMITRARARLGEGIRWHVGSGATLDPLPDACADLVFSYIVFQHIPSREVIESYVCEAARVLRPGGWFKFQVSGVAFAHEPDTWLGVTFNEAAAVGMAEGAGLSVVGVEGPGTQYLTLTTRKGPMPARTFVLPGAPWSAEHLVEGFGDAVDCSCGRCKQRRVSCSIHRRVRGRFIWGFTSGRTQSRLCSW
jgi:SAM-dependent methyltransferase